ncbi:MAG: hypothetical protein WAS51_12345, partial [Ilumatobacteraceae bacterium]
NLRPAGGRSEFTRSNILRRMADLSWATSLGYVSSPPTTVYAWEDTPPASFPVPLVEVGTNLWNLAFDTAADWNEAGGALLVWHSPALPSTRTFWRGAMNLCEPVLGAGAESPAERSLDFLPDVGGRVAFAFRYLRADGRVSDLYRTTVTATT